MADKEKSTKDKDSSDFSEREQKIMALSWLCLETDPKIDYAKLAGLLEYNNPKSVSNAWIAIRKKINAKGAEAGVAKDGDGEGGESPSQVKATPKKGTPKRKKATPAKDGENGNEDGEPATPTKKAKTPKSSGKGRRLRMKLWRMAREKLPRSSRRKKKAARLSNSAIRATTTDLH